MFDGLLDHDAVDGRKIIRVIPSAAESVCDVDLTPHEPGQLEVDPIHDRPSPSHVGLTLSLLLDARILPTDFDWGGGRGN